MAENSQIGKRKAVVSLTTVLLASILVTIGKITPEIWRDVVLPVTLGYLGLNVAQKIIEWKKKKNDN